MNRTLLAMKSSLSLPIVCVREGSDCLHRRNGYPACKVCRDCFLYARKNGTDRRVINDHSS